MPSRRNGAPVSTRSSEKSLAAALSNATLRSVGRRPCSLCEELKTMPKAKRDLVAQGIGSTIGIARLTTILQNHGVLVGRPTVARHREERH